MPIPTAPLTTAAEDDVDRSGMSRLRQITAAGSHADLDSIVGVIRRWKRESAVFGEAAMKAQQQVRADVLVLELLGAENIRLREEVSRLRALPPGSPSSQTDTGDNT